jgi:hypothetical protein
MQREHAIRQQAKLEGYRLEKRDDDSYRLRDAQAKQIRGTRVIVKLLVV